MFFFYLKLLLPIDPDNLIFLLGLCPNSSEDVCFGLTSILQTEDLHESQNAKNRQETNCHILNWLIKIIQKVRQKQKNEYDITTYEKENQSTDMDVLFNCV